MAEPSLIARQHALLHNLARLAADRGQAEPAIEQEAQSKRAAEESAFDEDYQTIIIHFASQKEQADREVREVRETIRGRFETEQAATARELARDRLRFAEQYDAEAEEAQAAFQEARWTIDAVHEASRSKADKQLQAGEDWVTAQRDRLLAMHLEARRLVEQWKLSPREPEEVPPAKSMRQVQEYLADVETGLARLKGLVLPRFLKGRRLLGGFVLLGLVLVFPLGFLVTGCFELEDTFDALYVSGLVASAAVTLLLGTATHALIASLVRSEVQRIWGPICQALAGTETWRKHILESYTTRHRRQVLEAEAVHARDLKKATDASRAKEESITSRRAADVGASEERARQQREASEKRQAGDLREAEGRYAARMAEAQQQYERDAREEQERHERTLREIDARRDTERQALAARWREGTDQAWAEVGEITRASGAVFPFWDDPCWDDWTPPAIVPEALRFGEYRVQLDLFTSPASGAESSRSGLPDFNLPALCPFPEQSLLFEAGEAGRSEAVAALQAVMFRLLTAFPPGKVRFTIVDPVGLGENFAAFMHLADYDAQLVASRIWTEQQHIEQRLADLTAHMENVIQKYLRNQYRTIAEYNEQAGEVAEPFRGSGATAGSRGRTRILDASR
ncbi:MAG: hypothetical protein HYS12_07050 [Planctomycetes bacterium]|nr:hypothetical protein [Planctomycetota bacterium]